MQQFFSVFYDEGVLLDIVSAGPYPCGGYAGVMVSGLNSGEDSKALADKFGIMNNDLITVVEGITLSSEANVEAALTDLSTTTDAVTLTIRRRGGTSCAASNYTITVTY